MALLVENGRPVQATRTKGDFCSSHEKQNTGFTNLIENEIGNLRNIETQFGLHVKF